MSSHIKTAFPKCISSYYLQGLNYFWWFWWPMTGVAICQPLHDTTIMSPQLCLLMVLASWIMNVFYSTTQRLMTLRLNFYTKLEIWQFFCELNQEVKNTCFDTHSNDLVVYFSAFLCACCPDWNTLILLQDIFLVTCHLITAWEVQNTSYLCVTLVSCLLNLLHRTECLPQFCFNNKFTVKCKSLCYV